MSERKFRVLFVCMGNICRSPAGENVFAKLVKDAGLEDSIAWDSAGTYGYHVGNTPDRRMTATLTQRGVPVAGRARQFQVSDFDDFDLILAMDNENYADIMSQVRNEKDKERLRKFVSFCNGHELNEVPDPYYGGADGFELVADMMLDGCAGILQEIQSGSTTAR